jgi:polyisoprenoid-binding protein YceI
MPKRAPARIRALILTTALLAACGPGDRDAPGAAELPPTSPDEAIANGEAAALVLAVAGEGNEARYRVREQLVGRDLPNDAVGVTEEVSGTIALDAAGRVIPDASRIVVDVAGLTSDQSRRDGYIRRRLLEAEEHPTVELQPTELHGVRLPLPASGSSSLRMEALLTIRGVTRPTTWDVDARFAGDTVTGTARTAFTFDDFQLTRPRVPIVASVADTIRLEYDFRLNMRVPDEEP